MESKHIQNFATFTEKLKQSRAIQEENEKSGKQDEYAQFFKKLLQKFNVTSPADLTDDKKKEFFDEISKGWESGEGLTPTGKDILSEGNNINNEGNAFTGALADAKEKGEEEFEVDGEKFKVEEK